MEKFKHNHFCRHASTNTSFIIPCQLELKIRKSQANKWKLWIFTHLCQICSVCATTSLKRLDRSVSALCFRWPRGNKLAAHALLRDLKNKDCFILLGVSWKGWELWVRMCVTTQHKPRTGYWVHYCTFPFLKSAFVQVSWKGKQGRNLIQCRTWVYCSSSEV